MHNVSWTWMLSFPVLSGTLHWGLFEMSYSEPSPTTGIDIYSFLILSFLVATLLSNITYFLYFLFLLINASIHTIGPSSHNYMKII